MKNTLTVCKKHSGAALRDRLQSSVSNGPNPLILIILLISLAVILPLAGCIGLTGATSAPNGSNTAATDSAPSITTQPSNQTVTAGQTATFSVGAAGAAPLTYQWSKNGAAIAGATSASYTTPATATSDNGTQFAVIVSNSAGNATSVAATLTVNAASGAPSITAQPVSQSVTVGQTAAFSVAASATAPLTYQWKKNGTAISGATSTSYTTPATAMADNGAQFAVTVTDSTGNTTSNAATLTVNAPGQIALSSSTLAFGSVNVGSSTSLSATLTNSGDSNVTISNVSISGAGFDPSGIPTGTILTPGQTVTLNTTFTPASSGSVTGNVTIVSNATNSPSKISLSGTGVAVVQHSVSLAWTTPGSSVAGYNVYRSTVSGGTYSKLTSSLNAPTSFADSTVHSGQTYYYVVTSVDSSNVESVYSNTATATIPTP